MITILDTGLGNPESVRNMLRAIGLDCQLSDQPDMIKQSQALIVPGVGSFDHGMQRLHDKNLVSTIKDHAASGRPLLGICLGAQLLLEGSEEGVETGLGLIKGRSIRFNIKDINKKLKVPHMGWNTPQPTQTSPLFDGLEIQGTHAMRFYHVHAYHMVCDNPDNVIATAQHGIVFASIIQHDNVTGMQFHPEKSHGFGKKLLSNYFKAVL